MLWVFSMLSTRLFQACRRSHSRSRTFPANASTVGYKGIGTRFEDLVPQSTTPDQQMAGGVTAHAQASITKQGTVSATAVATNMAISGAGFFNVQKPIGITDNSPVFDGVTNYTRRGDFQLNANGNLVNGAGYYLLGVGVDPETGSDFTPGFNPQVIGTPATPFSDATYTGSAVNNKAAVPAPITGATTLSGVPGTDSLTANFAVGDTLTVNGTVVTFVAAGAVGNQLNITDSVTALMAKIDSITGTASPSTVSGGAVTLHTGTASNLTVTSSNASALGALGFPSTVTASRGGGGTVGAGVVIGSDVTVFTNESISGGAVTAFDATGTAINLQLRWAKTDSASLGVGHTDTWNLFYQTNASATGAQTAWINAGTNFVFGTNGALVSPSGTSIVLSNVAVNNQSLGNLTFNYGAGGITQYASNGGTATINQVQQDGYAAGQLQSVAVNNSGLVVGTFSNGQNLNLAAVSLSHFNGPNYLKALDGGAYAATDQSGVAIAGATGSISGSSVENSNTDIADEFTKLIVTQQAYSANTKVITTAQTMVQDLLNVLR
jgi:flagellar hook protein FlgE